MLFMMPPGTPPFDVFPDQNHAEHLAKIEQFVKEEGGKLQPEQQQAVIAHKQKHEAFQYGQNTDSSPDKSALHHWRSGQGNPMGNGAAPPAIPDMAAHLAAQDHGGGAQPGGGAAGH
jgi:hypothetical protein